MAGSDFETVDSQAKLMVELYRQIYKNGKHRQLISMLEKTSTTGIVSADSLKQSLLTLTNKISDEQL